MKLGTNNYIAIAMNDKSQVDAFYLDMAKAFDKLNHSFLLKKLESLGIGERLVNWFKSYLSQRKNRVSILGHLSNEFQPSSGVPQGSILGPFLFLIYINDLTSEVKFCKIEMFADDAKIMKKITSQQDCHDLQSDISRVVVWCNTWHLPLNMSKCSMMTSP